MEWWLTASDTLSFFAGTEYAMFLSLSVHTVHQKKHMNMNLTIIVCGIQIT